MILTVAVSGYRSLRNLVLPLAPLTVITGGNGVGKSSLYRALRMLGEVSQGRLISTLAFEGGLSSTMWAGPEVLSRRIKSGEVPITGTVRSKPIGLKLGFASEDYGYAVELGLPAEVSTFSNDPEIKTEAMWIGEKLSRNNAIAERHGPSVRVRSEAGSWSQAATSLPPFDSMMTHATDSKDALELLHLRDRMRNWRFYDQLRTDRDAPARKQQVGTRTPILASDGSDLAAAIETIREIGDPVTLDETILDAFPRSSVEVHAKDSVFVLSMRQHGLLRPLSTAELSDGTLRYLFLVAALLTPRPSSLMVLNEPETSLHPSLMLPLARLIKEASKRSQIIVISHSPVLAEALSEDDVLAHRLEKDTGETVAPAAEQVSWSWPKR
ncbi:AAA family ATPase [Ruegeria sp. Ofav3-42]|uniref:AAA family ATPase n=1 Tax=Ruegeria sp. Ofav3-42 TaxID=2917759 RepID=UPI001EF725F0|nr:AAA family ATPase [Ruegeria sp. Ofav3-42]MCG7522370.1 AAA family ATPase [Ruegeria sp. Ofav3-42]